MVPTRLRILRYGFLISFGDLVLLDLYSTGRAVELSLNLPATGLFYRR